MGKVACWNTLMDENRHMVRKGTSLSLLTGRARVLLKVRSRRCRDETVTENRAVSPEAPLTAVLLVFLGIPLAVVVAVSFFDYDDFAVRPAFMLRTYLELFGSGLTYTLYLKTLTYAAIVWALTLAIGFHRRLFPGVRMRTLLWQMALFLLCTVPF